MSDRLAAVGDPGLRAALLEVRRCERGATADELAERTGIHRNVARDRLERLAASELLTVRFERRERRGAPGPGRPAKVYRPAPELEAIEFPAGRYETLMCLLAESVAGQAGERGLREIGAEFGRRLARTHRPNAACPGAEGICAALRASGYQAGVESFGGDGAVIVTATCPLRPLLAEQPALRAVDRGMWAGLAEATLGDVSADAIDCELDGCLARDSDCRIRLTFHSKRR
jgi:predicted ArsR family transcriptional regulator